MTRKLPHHRYEEMKRLAADLIEDYALAYPLDPLEVAAVLGVQVTIHPLGLPASAVVAAGTADGYTVAVDSAHGLRFHIHVSGATAQARLRFTLVHELAHVWLDHHRSGSRCDSDQAEAEANFFAGYLLAPDALILKWVEDRDVAEIATCFQLSDEAARLAYGRVTRVVTNRVPPREHDLRILSGASRRIGDNRLGAFGDWWESA